MKFLFYGISAVLISLLFLAAADGIVDEYSSDGVRIAVHIDRYSTALFAGIQLTISVFLPDITDTIDPGTVRETLNEYGWEIVYETGIPEKITSEGKKIETTYRIRTETSENNTIPPLLFTCSDKEGRTIAVVETRPVQITITSVLPESIDDAVLHGPGPLFISKKSKTGMLIVTAVVFAAVIVFLFRRRIFRQRPEEHDPYDEFVIELSRTESAFIRDEITMKTALNRLTDALRSYLSRIAEKGGTMGTDRDIIGYLQSTGDETINDFAFFFRGWEAVRFGPEQNTAVDLHTAVTKLQETGRLLRDHHKNAERAGQ